MPRLRYKLFSKLIPKISICFCCFGEINEDISFSSSFHRLDCKELSKQHAGLCKIPQICPNVLRLLSKTTTELLHSLFIENCLCRVIEDPIHTSAFVSAAGCGDIELLKTLVQEVDKSSCRFNQETIEQACIFSSARGHLKTTEFLFKKVIPERSHFISSETLRRCCISAAAHGHDQVLEFLFVKVFPQSRTFIDQELLTHCCICASANGHRNVLKFLFTKAFPENLFFIEQPLLNCCSIFAAANGQVQVLKFLFKKIQPKISFLINHDMFSDSFVVASSNAQLEVLQFLFKLAHSKSDWFLESDLLDLLRY
jgi:hypothetical protein